MMNLTTFLRGGGSVDPNRIDWTSSRREEERLSDLHEQYYRRISRSRTKRTHRGGGGPKKKKAQFRRTQWVNEFINGVNKNEVVRLPFIASNIFDLNHPKNQGGLGSGSGLGGAGELKVREKTKERNIHEFCLCRPIYRQFRAIGLKTRFEERSGLRPKRKKRALSLPPATVSRRRRGKKKRRKKRSRKKGNKGIEGGFTGWESFAGDNFVFDVKVRVKSKAHTSRAVLRLPRKRVVSMARHGGDYGAKDADAPPLRGTLRKAMRGKSLQTARRIHEPCIRRRVRIRDIY